MGATNSTLHYQLSQFISTDKPAWLQDYNGDMQKIDVGINGALVAAESAQNSADTANTGVGAVSNAVTALQTTVTGHTSDITDLSGDVNTIEALIGNGTPTAGDRTIIGASNANTDAISQLNSSLDDATTAKLLANVQIATSSYDFNSDGYLLIEGNTTGKLYGSNGVYFSIASSASRQIIYVRKGMNLRDLVGAASFNGFDIS